MAKTKTPQLMAINTSPGIVTLFIHYKDFGLAGRHWYETLKGTNNGGYGKIYIYRNAEETKANRDDRWFNYERNEDRAVDGCDVDIDECPGAMFIWERREKMASHLEVEAWGNRRLGTAMGSALRPYANWMQVKFDFV